MTEYCWSEDVRWWKPLCGNLLLPETAIKIHGCIICIKPIEVEGTGTGVEGTGGEIPP